MTHWTATIEAATAGGPIDDLVDHLDEFTDALAPHAGIVTGTPRAATDTRYGATITVEAATAALAATTAEQVFTQAAERAGLPAAPIISLEVETIEETDRKLAIPTPTLVGIAEIAELLGVTRQRASALQARGGFPRPAATLRAGPVWALRDIDTFRSQWARLPGRPRRAGTVNARAQASPIRTGTMVIPKTAIKKKAGKRPTPKS